MAGRTVSFGPFELEREAGEVRKHGLRLKLPERSFRILAALLERPGALVTREELEQRIWPSGTLSDSEHGLNKAMNRLREVLNDSADDPRLIETVPGRGYRFIGAVQGESAVAEEIAAPAPVMTVPAVWPGRAWFGAAVVFALSVGAGIWVVVVRKPPAPALARLIVTTDQERPLGPSPSWPQVTLSDDGTRLAYTGMNGAVSHLYVRRMDEFEALSVAGSDGAYAPFFSPDGRWLAFFAEGKLKKSALSGDQPVVLVDAPRATGGTWASDNTIFFAPRPNQGIWRISAGGGAPQQVTQPDAPPNQGTHRWPAALPDSKAILLTEARRGESFDDARIVALSLETGRRQLVVDGGANARYSNTGHVVFARAGKLLALPFDAKRLQVTGSPVQVLDSVETDVYDGAAQFSLSSAGSLVYLPAPPPKRHMLVWANRAGSTSPVIEAPAGYRESRLSRDGRKIVVVIGEPKLDLWLVDVSRATLSRLTSEGSNSAPIWAPDGKSVVFSAARGGAPNIFRKWLDDSREERLTDSANAQFPTSWSLDGKYVLYTEIDADTAWDIWVLPLDRKEKPWPWLRTRFIEGGAAFSPDGRWIAHTSNEPGTFEIFVRPLRRPEQKWQISPGGAPAGCVWPLWTPDGRELFYGNAGKLYGVSITSGAEFSVSKPRLVLDGPFQWSADISRDGRFLLIKGEAPPKPVTQMHLVLNWFHELKR